MSYKAANRTIPRPDTSEFSDAACLFRDLGKGAQRTRRRHLSSYYLKKLVTGVMFQPGAVTAFFEENEPEFHEHAGEGPDGGGRMGIVVAMDCDNGALHVSGHPVIPPPLLEEGSRKA